MGPSRKRDREPEAVLEEDEIDFEDVGRKRGRSNGAGPSSGGRAADLKAIKAEKMASGGRRGVDDPQREEVDMRDDDIDDYDANDQNAVQLVRRLKMRNARETERERVERISRSNILLFPVCPSKIFKKKRGANKRVVFSHTN